VASCQRLVPSGFHWQLTTGCWQLGQGAVAQLGERLVCNQEATGSIPVSSTKFRFPDTLSLMLGVNATSVIQFTVNESCDWRRTLGWQQLNPPRRAEDSIKSRVFSW
jgi:hypothetical protein